MHLGWRNQRQIIIFFTYFLIVFIPVFIISYSLLKKSPSCFDGLQNAGEEGVDCNGSCSLQCLGTYRDIKINFVRSLKVSDNVYDIFALLENFNTEIEFPNVPYELTFYSAEGKLLGTTTNSISILPQQRSVIFLPSLYMLQAPKTVDLKLLPHKALFFKDSKNIPKNVSVESWQAQRGANESLQVVGELKNPNNYEVTNISVYAMLYDETKTVYAVSGTKVNRILGRQTQAVTFTWGNLSTPKNIEFVVVQN